MFSARSVRILLILFTIGILGGMLFYPFGYDQAAFTVAGDMSIRHGAVSYRDFLDTKPPLIFIIYGVSSLIFGYNEIAIRIFDVLYHLATLWFFYTLLKRTVNDEWIAFGSVVFYAIIYVTSGFWMTAQAESFALLPSLILFDQTEKWLQGKTNTFRAAIIVAIATSLLFFLKFTLLAVAAASFCYLLLKKKKGTLVFISISLGLFLLSVVGYLIYMNATGALHRFIESVQWLQGYSSIDSVFALSNIGKELVRKFSINTIYVYSLTGIALLGIGLATVFKRKGESATAYLHLGIQLFFSILAVIFERKFFQYQYARTFWAFVPFATVGVVVCWRLLRQWLAKRRELPILERGYRYLGVCCIIAVVLLFSPVSHLLSNPLHWVTAKILKSRMDFAQDVENNFGQYYYRDQQEVADKLKSIMQPQDKIFLWGNGMGLYCMADRYPTTFCLTNTPLVTAWTPAVWKNDLLKDLGNNPPRFFISESGDDRPYITGDSLDSYQHLRNWKELNDFVEARYVQKEKIGHFYLFERK